jgi:hypothetical protein
MFDGKLVKLGWNSLNFFNAIDLRFEAFAINVVDFKSIKNFD